MRIDVRAPCTADERRRRMISYLQSCSTISLDAFQLDRLNRVANLRKALRGFVEDWIEAAVEAQMAVRIAELRKSMSGSRPEKRNRSAPEAGTRRLESMRAAPIALKTCVGR